ncbi:unnamed protein product [Rhizoctonia solani]|uniref:Uncharacterized protein n=1 Tax=Rhizoctonia solani TaxID=456999 RepID=A0A8H3BIC3_9AGAM|nr:unnamed protein product [Rhizoctonia solani]
MSLASESTSPYGPTLDEYLDLQNLQLHKPNSHSSAGLPSREEIRQAILHLSEPEKVTYLTFEIILSLEKKPVCSNLDLLLSESAKASLPACFRLVSAYCKGGRLIFGHAYGFLCVKVISLFVQFAMLSRTGYRNGLDEMLASDRGEQSIFLEFTTTTYAMMVGLMEDQLDSGPSARHDLFGWQDSSLDGGKICLSEIGGCTAGQIQFLLRQLWDSRAEFVSCGARGRAVLFPGFSGFLCWIWSGVAQQHGLPGTRQTPTPAWTQLVDLSIRFTLYCNDQEADLVSFVLLACPGSARDGPILNRSNSAVNTQDATQIATLTPVTIGSNKSLPLRMVTTLFCFACPSVNYEQNISNIFSAKLERLWFELDQRHNPELSEKDLPFYCQGFLHVLTAMQDRNPRSFLSLLSSISEELYEAVGRIILLPLSLSGLFQSPSSLDNLKLLFQTTSVYVRDMYARTTIEPPIDFPIRTFPIWNKVLSQLRFLELFQSKHRGPVAEYIKSWSDAWSSTAIWFEGKKPFGGAIVVEDANKLIGSCPETLIKPYAEFLPAQRDPR